MSNSIESQALETIRNLAAEASLDLEGASVRRTSSRFCLGVEHGDYNGTELFGVGTDRFIWLAWKANDSGRIRLFSANFPDDGVVEFTPGQVPEPQSSEVTHSWARFPFGVDYILRRAGYATDQGMDIALYGNIPGGGMSRSASLSINLILTVFEANGIAVDDDFTIIDLAQAVENEYIGSPCGQLDQIMIYFAKEGMGTHYNPRDKSIEYVPLGDGAADFRIVGLDTGTVRPGLEKSTYKIRRQECDDLAALIQESHGIACLGDIRDTSTYEQLLSHYQDSHPDHCLRMRYIVEANQRFGEMLAAWKEGDIDTVGRLFRMDGLGLRDLYQISGPELETMCDIVRTVPGTLGERMLGGGDKGAAGALVQADAVDALRAAVDTAYPRSRPDFATRYAVHVCKVVDGVRVLDEKL